MNQQPFVIERSFHASVAKVWQAITDKDQMKQWYFDMPQFKPVEGTQFSFTGTDAEGKQWVHLCTVTEVVPYKKLTYSWKYQGYEGNSYVTWELFEQEAGTLLRLTHSGLETFPSIQSLARENFAKGWTEIIGSMLRSFLAK